MRDAGQSSSPERDR